MGVRSVAFGVAALFIATMLVVAQERSNPPADNTRIEPAALAGEGGKPFHIAATITEGREREPVATMEMYWLSPRKWRRVIKGEDFSQTLIVNDDSIYEEDSDDYFPVGLRALVTAVIDPRQMMETTHRSEDSLKMQLNGLADHSGFSKQITTPGYAIRLSDYRQFAGRPVARRIDFIVGVGEFETLMIDELSEVESVEESVFAIANPTPKQDQIRSVMLPESEMRAASTSTPQIIWPQVLDGAVVGDSSFYVSIDRSGDVREVLPIRTANERSNDSARRQIMKWKFKPMLRNGVPVQAEAVLNFRLNTRAWGPSEPLSDAEVRNLATKVVDPVAPAGTAAGANIQMRIAVDADGVVIEQIAGDGTPSLVIPCMRAIAMWKFRPLLENGQPRPFRASILCSAS